MTHRLKLPSNFIMISNLTISLTICTLFLATSISSSQSTSSVSGDLGSNNQQDSRSQWSQIAHDEGPSVPLKSTRIATPVSTNVFLSDLHRLQSYKPPLNLPEGHTSSPWPQAISNDHVTKFSSPDDDDTIESTSTSSSTTTTAAAASATTSNQNVTTIATASRANANSVSEAPSTSSNPITTISSASHKPTPTSRAHAVSHESINHHPLLIFSMRYEIRYFNLSTLSTNSQSQSRAPQSPPVQIIPPTLSPEYQTLDLQQLQHHQPPQSHHHPPIRQSKTLIGGLKNTIGLDFYYTERESFLFWMDVIDERIYRGTIINGAITNVDIVVQTGLATAEGLAVDWIGLNIYWVESTLDHIEVANLNGTYRRTLIAGDMESPRAIAVDPRVGLLFWTDWDKRVPRIERATMAGEDREVLVQIRDVKGGWPNGLTLDYDSKRIYWIDANSDSIHNVDYDGNNYQSILKTTKLIGHPFSIALFENNLFWTDWKTNSVSMANKLNGSEARELQRLTARLFDIKVFHPSRQPKIDNHLNPCHINNGNCSHFCLLSLNHLHRCDCPNLMKLSHDFETCIPDENFLLIGRANEIRAVDIGEPLHHIMAPISVPKVFSPKQFAFDAKSKSIFWIDSQTNEVKRAPIAGSNIETIIDVIIEPASGLALDWISGNIYVASGKPTSKIFISNLNGEFVSVLMDSAQGIVSPQSLVVHPVLGLLFCVDENENMEPIIFASGMDGKNKRIIASKMNNPSLENPTSLAIDYDLNRVYWINQASHTHQNSSIQFYDIKEDRIVTIWDESEMSSSQKLNPSVLCIDGDRLIISGKTPTEVIVTASKFDVSGQIVRRTQNMDQISALQVFNASSQVGTNACSLNNGNCSQLCVPTNSTHRACECAMSYTMNTMNETECLGKDLFLIYSNNLGMKGIGVEPSALSFAQEEQYLPPIHKAFKASSIDFVHQDSMLYWIDNEEGSIVRIKQDTTNYKSIIQGLESEESVAIDWVGGNMYWLDPYYDVIEVARLNGTNRYVIVSGDMDKANSIAVNPLKGYIVWSDTGHSYPKIETAGLDGSNRRVIVSKSLSHVDDLAIDYKGDFIYWVDSTQGTVERIKPDGIRRQIIYGLASPNQAGSSNSHLVSIALHNDYLFVADSIQNSGSIFRCDKNNGTNKVMIKQHIGDGIRDIVVYGERPIPSADINPCVSNNGNCQDLCLFTGKPGKRRCICSHGKLKQDGMTCEPYDTFILYSKLSQIETLHITEDELPINSPYSPITIENRSSIISLTVDHSARRVIYSELTQNQICSVFFNGTDKRVLVENQIHVEGIAFADDQLYWTNIYDNSISRLNTTSSGQVKSNCDEASGSCTKIEKLVKLSSEDKPRGIAIDRCTNYVYWTNWNANASIQRASPHNNYKVESIITTNIKIPNGIAIDHKQRRLYWCDARLDKIEHCAMDGTDREILVSAAPQHPFALAVWDNYIFWTDWLARGVFRASKYTGHQSTPIKKVVQRPMGIAIAAPEMSAAECPVDKCATNNGGCPADHVCRHRNYPPVDIIQCSLPTSINGLRDQTPLLSHKNKTGTYLDILQNRMDRYNLTGDFLTVDFKPQSETPQETTSQLTPRISTDAISPASTSTNRFIDGLAASTTSSTIAPVSVTTDQSQRQPKTPAETKDDDQQSPTISQRDKLPGNRKPYKPPPPPLVATTSAPLSISTTTTDSPTTPKMGKDIQQSVPASHIPNAIKPAASKTESTTSSATTIAPGNSTTVTATTTPTNLTPLPAPQTNATNGTQQQQPCQIVPAALQPTTDTSASSACESPNQFRCYLSEKVICIPNDKRCDGNYDCASKEDENECFLSKGKAYSVKHEPSWHRFVTVILVILAAAIAAMFLVFGTRGRRRWFASTTGAFNHRRMFDDNNGTNIEISNPMFDEDDPVNLSCPFSIDLNERTTNFSNPLYERQVLLMTDKLGT